MIHCIEYIGADGEYNAKGIRAFNISKPESSNEVLNFKVIITAPNSVISMSQSDPISSTLFYEIWLGAAMNEVCAIRLRFNENFILLREVSCRIPTNAQTAINVIARKDGWISVYLEGNLTPILEVKNHNRVPINETNYIFFTAPDGSYSKFYYNCKDYLKECNTYSSKEFGYYSYFPIEGLSRSYLANILLNITFTVWNEKGDAYVQLSPIKEPHPLVPTYEFVIESESHQECVLRTPYNNEVLFRRECIGLLVSNEPVEVTLSISLDNIVVLAFSNKNGKKMIVDQIHSKHLLSMNYVSFGSKDTYTKYFFGCPNHLQNCKSYETVSFGYDKYFPIEDFSNIRTEDEEINMNIAIMPRDGEVFILFTPTVEPGDNITVIDISLGGANDTKCQIANRLHSSKPLLSSYCPQLAAEKLLNIYITITKYGSISVYLDNSLIMQANAQEPVTMNYVSFSSSNFNTAKFIYDCPEGPEVEDESRRIME